MFVEYLFTINPLTLLLVVLTGIFFAYKYSGNSNEGGSNDYIVPGFDVKQYDKGVDHNQTIFILSYNIMAYNFTKFQWFPYCSPEYLPPRYRSPRILQEIEQTKADVLSLQECDHDLFMDYYKPNFEKLGYSCIYQSVLSNRIVTNVICFKNALFNLDEWKHLDLNEELSTIDESFLKHKEALFVQLTHKHTGKKFVVVNTHLFWNPEFEYVKYGQMMRVLQFIEKHYKHLPTVLCGDFNSLPTSNVIKYIYSLAPDTTNTNFKGDATKNKKFIDFFWANHVHGLKLRSAYDIFKHDSVKDVDDYADGHPDFTTYTQEFVGTLDYIFYNPEKLKVTELVRIPTNDQEVRGLKLPNFKYPSDHLKIGARFKFI
jgi:CCR4-NOT transcription complex subunit 6